MNRWLRTSYCFMWGGCISFAVAVLPSCSKGNIAETEDALDRTIVGVTTADVFQSTSAIAASLSQADKKRFADVRFEYIVAYGEDGMAERIRGKTVRKVLDEFQPTRVDPIKTGVTDGVDWKLYSKPEPPPDIPDKG